jgi:methyltransferase family protein
MKRNPVEAIGPQPADVIEEAGAAGGWRFERASGEVLAQCLRLAPGGRILGHVHSNEASWSIDGGKLCFRTRDGRVSTRFHTVDGSTGLPRLIGDYMLEGPALNVHVLAQTRLPFDGQAPAPRAEPISNKELIQTLETCLFGSSGGAFDVLHMAALDAAVSSARYYQQSMLTAQARASAFELLTLACDRADTDGLVLEFGVASGMTINHIARHFPGRPIHGFDSFRGLPENWRTGIERGAFARQEPPRVEPTVSLYPGLFNDTAPAFAALHPGPIALLHVDCDLYSSTVTVLEAVGSRLRPGSIVVFDEYFNYPGWQQHEFKAWQEFVAASGVRYEYLGLVRNGQQVAVRITSI